MHPVRYSRSIGEITEKALQKVEDLMLHSHLFVKRLM